MYQVNELGDSILKYHFFLKLISRCNAIQTKIPEDFFVVFIKLNLKLNRNANNLEKPKTVLNDNNVGALIL